MGAGEITRPLLQSDSASAPSAPPMPGDAAFGGMYPSVAPPAAYPQPVQGTPMYPSVPIVDGRASTSSGVPYMAPTMAAPTAQPIVEQHVSCTHVHVNGAPMLNRMNSAPKLHFCPSCGATGATVVRRESGCCTWLAAFGMCWLCCPCFWLPFCCGCAKDTVHRCSRCGAELARIKPI